MLAVAEPDPRWAPAFHTPILGTTTDGPGVALFANRLMVASKGMRAGHALNFAHWQRWALDFILQRNARGYFQMRQAVLGLPRKTAKAADVHERVLTANRGWVEHGDLTVDDEVFHPSGHPIRVLHRHPTLMADCFQVTTTDGRSVVVAGDHEWTVRDAHTKRVAVYETREMFLDAVDRSMGGHEYRFRLPPVEPPDDRLVTRRTRSLLGANRSVAIASIERVHRRAVNCITVDSPDGLYLLGDLIPTHNSLMGSAIALYYLVGNPDLGREIYSLAGDRQQAKLVFGEARWQVLQNPALERELRVYRDAIEHPVTGSVYRVLSHDGKLAQGLNPFCVLADEAHVYPGTPADPRTSEMWEAMAQGGGARPESLLIAITTAGNNFETLLGRLYQYALKVARGSVVDPTFGAAWWAAPDGCDWRDERFWHTANPNLALDLADIEDMRAAARTTPEAIFRRYRLNQFVHGGGITWMDMAAWARQEDRAWRPAPGERIVMAFDGSVTDDATALVGMTLDRRPTLFVLGMWIRPPHAEDDWQVPRDEVMEAVEDAFELYDVRIFQADTSYWLAEFRTWQERHGKRRVLDFTMSNARMVPAAQELYSAICDGQAWHNGDARLTEHVGNAVTHETPRGLTIKKDAKDSRRKIDLAVAACMANDARLRIPQRSGPSAWGF